MVNAGPDLSVQEHSVIQLHATATDSEGQALTYTWTQTGGPSVVLSGVDGSSPTFHAPQGVTNTTLEFQVAVSDGVNTSTDSVVVTINVNDDAPRITSAPNLVASEGEVVQLHAAAVDPEGQGLQYAWRQVGGPSVTLVHADSQGASLGKCSHCPRARTCCPVWSHRDRR